MRYISRKTGLPGSYRCYAWSDCSAWSNRAASEWSLVSARNQNNFDKKKPLRCTEVCNNDHFNNTPFYAKKDLRLKLESIFLDYIHNLTNLIFLLIKKKGLS